MEMPDVTCIDFGNKEESFVDVVGHIGSSTVRVNSVIYYPNHIVEALKSENEQLKAKYQETDILYWQQVREIAELKAKLEKAKNTLRFYGDKENHLKQYKIEDCGYCGYWHEAEINEDQGQRARTTLEELG